MKGIRVDSELLADAESNYVEIIDSLDDQAQAYADQFHSSVIVPFCNRHNLRFWSGNGVWFFEAPGVYSHIVGVSASETRKKVFEDPSFEILRWAIATGNAEYRDDCRAMCGKSWQVTCTDDELPEFLYNLSEIHRLLNLDFMSGCLGYWISDFRPKTFPLHEWEK